MSNREYLLRRKKEIELEIGMREDYVEKSEPTTWKENGTGRSYNSRRKSRFSGVHQTRINDFKRELIGYKEDLKEINKELSCLQRMAITSAEC